MKKWMVIALLWGVHISTEMIRVSLAVAAPTLMQLYNIEPQVMGYVLSGWNWGYTVSLLFAGVIVDRFGPWIVMGTGWGLWSLATASLPLASGAASIFTMRALFGAANSVRLPSQASALTRWFDKKERTSAVGVAFSGNQVGPAFGTALAGTVLTFSGWQGVFYWIGGVSFLFSILWLILYPDKRIGRIAPERQDTANAPVKRVPISTLLRHRAVWGMILAQAGYLYAYFFFLTWLPSYLILERKMTVLRTGFIASLPFILGMLGTVGGGYLGDFLIRRGFSRTASRKTIIGVGLSLSTLMVVTAAYTSLTWLAVSLLTLCVGCMRLATASLHSTPLDLAPPGAVATLASMQNFAGNVSALLGTIVTGYIVQATGSFALALAAAGGMAMFGTLSYLILVQRLEPLQIAPVPARAQAGA